MMESGPTRMCHVEGPGPTGLQIYNRAVPWAGPDPRASAILLLCKKSPAAPVLLLNSITYCVTGPVAGLGMAYCANK